MWMVFKTVNQDGDHEKSECGKVSEEIRTKDRDWGNKDEPEKEP